MWTIGYFMPTFTYWSHGPQIFLMHKDIFMLWAIKNNIFINWPHQIMQHMLKCRDNNMVLPYTLLVARILHVLSVDLTIESSVHLGCQIILVKKHCTNWIYFKWMVRRNMEQWMTMTMKMMKSHHNPMTMFNNPQPRHYSLNPSWWSNVFTDYDWYLGLTLRIQ